MNIEIAPLPKLPALALRLPRFSHPLPKWSLAFLPLLLCLAAAPKGSGWVLMWLLAVALFAGAKWLSIANAVSSRRIPAGRMGVYLFLWPGLNVEEFCFEKGTRPAAGEWLMSGAKTALGAAILWKGLRLLPASDPILIGWMGMIGIALVFHFGFVHLLSNLWRAFGFNAQSIMKNPLRSTSVAGFWGRRWNKAFNDLVAPHVFAPVAAKYGAKVAALVVFLASGLLHEVVISLPARGGFGLPTLYFATQAAGLLVERSGFGRRIGLGRGLRGWLFTVAVTGVPAYWLFHPIFIRNVILPMLSAIGAT